ncbi:MAG: zinc ribbon domain-containing protein [Clostridiales bacterium]|nr:zinc ribbon domain-containing protein [Clostridiales bacterium]
MFCNYCGKELADSAKFCNYCGAQTTAAVHTQPAPQPVAQAAPAQPEQPADAQQPQQKKKGNFLVTAIIALVVFFVVRSLTINALTGKTGSSSTPYNNSSSQSGGLIDVSSSKPSPLSNCFYGALYHNGTLTYGSARLHLSGYHLLNNENGGADLLVSSDESIYFGVDKSVEVGVSYAASDKNDMLSSFSGSEFSNVKMVSFKKYTVDGYPVIRYIVRCTMDGLDQYIGELIVFPAKQANELMRFNMFALAEAGTAPIDQVFDTLSISSDYDLSSGETVDFGINQITFK